MTNGEMALDLAEKAKEHALAAGTAANDVDIKARVGGLVFSQGGGTSTEMPTLLAVAAMAHAHAAQAFKEAALAYASLPSADSADPVS